MLFNSYEYLLFFPLVTMVYFALPWVKARVIWLLIASYFFYMCWNPIFIILIIVSTVVDYFAGRAIANSKGISRKKLFLWLSLFCNLGILFYFKYYNFLKDNLQYLIDQLGANLVIPDHTWLLPVGISFYTFQTLSYTIDVYRGKQEVENSFFIFALYADEIFNNPGEHFGIAAIMGAVFFSFQIYCDFSGYTDIAIGSARVLGYRLMDNFKGPYFSKSIKEFWRRWHISLSTWFRDYLYIPLGGNRLGTYKLYRNLIIVFLITGLWHGANWTFVVWGIFHGFFLIIERIGWAKILEKTPSFLRFIYTFVVVTIGWVFFRADSMSSALDLLQNMIASDGNFFNINIYGEDIVQIAELQISLILLGVVAIIHLIEYKMDIVEAILRLPIFVRWPIYVVLIYSIPLLGQYGVYKPFIYFQF